MEGRRSLPAPRDLVVTSGRPLTLRQVSQAGSPGAGGRGRPARAVERPQNPRDVQGPRVLGRGRAVTAYGGPRGPSARGENTPAPSGPAAPPAQHHAARQVQALCHAAAARRHGGSAREGMAPPSERTTGCPPSPVPRWWEAGAVPGVVALWSESTITVHVDEGGHGDAASRGARSRGRSPRSHALLDLLSALRTISLVCCYIKRL